MADLTKFFNAFSERAYKENDLSDVTYALLMADVKFRQFFFDFFFHDAHLDSRHVTIEREHSDVLGRPDFWLKSDKGELHIVEVKIWDGNHHFEQYYDILAGDKKDGKRDDPKVWQRLGYIANYEISKTVEGDKQVKDLGCCVHTWKEFYYRLEEYDWFDDAAIMAYAKYLKRVCPFDDFKVKDEWEVKTADFLTIQSFSKNIIETIKKAEGCKLYNTRRRFRSQQWMGQYFEWTIGEANKARGWFGAYYKDSGAVVCVEFEDIPGLGKEICEKYANLTHDGYLRFCSKQSGEIVRDAEKLTLFFNGVLNLLSLGEDIPMDSESFWTNFDNAQSNFSNELFSMKCLPFVLENYLVTEDFKRGIAGAGYAFTLVHGNDEEVPESHCGRYFELRRKDNAEASKGDAEKANAENDANEKTATYRGWIGVDYNANCKWFVKNEAGQIVEGKTFAENPVFVVEISSNFQGAKDWKGNTWGWKCCEIGEGAMQYEKAMSAARKKLLELCNK